jgi:hypothetical protein
MAGRFLGLWKLLPETSKSELGPPAAKGTQLITAGAGDSSPKNPTIVDIKVNFTDVNGNQKEHVFHMNLNEEKSLHEHEGRKILVKSELTGPNILKSTGYSEDGQHLALEFTRELKEDGKFLEI